MVLTQKATLERTSEWAEKAAALISANQSSHSVHRASASDSTKDSVSHRTSKPAVEPLHSPLGSPTGVNPRDIPLELRGGTARDPRDPPPRDPRDRSPHGERDDREPGEIPEDRLARTEPRRESRDLDTSARQQPARAEDRTENKPVIKAEKDLEIEKTVPKKDIEATERDVDLEFDTWSGAKTVERKRTDSKTKLSPRSQSPSSKQLPVSKKPSSGRLSSERGPDDDAEPGMCYHFIFFARDSIYAIAPVRLSVCLSVCPSVTLVDQSKTLEVRIMQLSPPGSPMTLVSSRISSPRNSKGNLGSECAK